MVDTASMSRIYGKRTALPDHLTVNFVKRPWKRHQRQIISPLSPINLIMTEPEPKSGSSLWHVISFCMYPVPRESPIS